MRSFEVITACLLFTALALRIIGLPGGIMLLFLSAIILSMFYFYLGFAYFNGISFRGIFKKKSYVSLTATKIVYAIITGWVWSWLPLVVLFKGMAWPGLSLIQTIALAVFIIFSLITLLSFLITKKRFFKLLLPRLLIGLLITAVFFILPESLFV